MVNKNEKKSIDETLLIKYFSGELTGELVNAVEDWISASEQNRIIARQVEQIYWATEISSLIESGASQLALERVNRKIKKVSVRQQLFQLQKIAAILFLPLLALSLYFFVGYQSRTKPTEIFVKANAGMTSNLVLPDGTKVWLNSESSIRYPSQFEKNRRRVEVDGEAFFDVTKDKGKKFIVASKKVDIEVLGTKFNVDAYSENEHYSATLEAGSINLIYKTPENKEEHVLMKPNQKTEIDFRSHSVKTHFVDIEPDIAWKDGRIVFRNTSMNDVLYILSKKFNVQFDVLNSQIINYSFSGVFVHQDLTQILRYFNISSGIKSRFLDNQDSSNREKPVIQIY